MKVLGTGLTGLMGSRVVQLLSLQYEFVNLSRITGVDITNKEQVSRAIEHSDAGIVLHLAAKTNVDACEKDKVLGERGDAWVVNVEGTKNIAESCLIYNKKLIYISTDFVFDGEKEFYNEDDTPNPINWYAQTKYEGEKIVKGLQIPWIILRIAYPYRASFPKLDFVRVIKNRLQQKQEVKGITDHIFSPTFIDDIAAVFHGLITENATGIYHTVGSEALTPYDAATKIAHTFGLDTRLITQIKRDVYFSGKARRPFRLALKNDKIKALGYHLKPFSEGLQEVKKQQAL